jgi:hypothetical protein
MKILITGTGRSGTSFLMHLFTELGLSTGYSKDEANNSINRLKDLRAGIEHIKGDDRWDSADIVKNPQYAIVEKFKLIQDEISHVIIPIRNLTETAKSREKCNTNHGRYGGFWLGAETVEEQETANAKLIYNLIEYLTKIGMTFTTIGFPAMVHHTGYAFDSLNMIDVSYTEFSKAHKKIADIGKITIKENSNS